MSFMKTFWWEGEPEDPAASRVHETLFDTVRTIEEYQYAIHKQTFINAALYCNRELPGLDWGSHTERNVDYKPVSNTAENLVASVVNTVSALISKNKPKPTPVVKDASFAIERLGKQLDRYLYGEFQHQDIWAKGQKVFNDACWAPLGALKVYTDNGEIHTERVMPDEIIVDQREVVSGQKPFQLYQRKLVPRVVLEWAFPGRKREIQNAQSSGNFYYTSYRSPSADNVVVIEAWKLGKDGSPGRHSIVIDGATLLDETYDRDRFPFVFFRWENLPTGFYGKPLVEEIAPFQLRMNELNHKIRLAQDLMCVPRIFVDGGSRIVKTQLDNQIARVIHYRGKTPEPMNWPGISPEIYAERERIRASAFEYAGISQMSAQAKLPDQARLDSSKAIREYNAVENQRFSLQAQRYEAFFLEVAEHFMELASNLYESGTDRSVRFHNRKLIDDIAWSDVKDLVANRQYVLQIEASSVMNMSPAARMDELDSLAFRGLIDTNQYKSNLGHPDLEEVQALGSIGMDNIKMTAEQLDREEFPQPDPLQDLNAGIPFIHLTYLRRVEQKAPETILQNYRDWIALAQGIVDAAAAQAQELAKQQEEAAMMAAMASGENFEPQNIGPEGNLQSAVATSAQGIPVERAGVG